jgi:hypothetical protein
VTTDELHREIELLREEVDALRDWILGDPGVSYGPASFRAFQAIPSYAVPSSRKGPAADAVDA